MHHCCQNHKFEVGFDIEVESAPNRFIGICYGNNDFIAIEHHTLTFFFEFVNQRISKIASVGIELSTAEKFQTKEHRLTLGISCIRLHRLRNGIADKAFTVAIGNVRAHGGKRRIVR